MLRKIGEPSPPKGLKLKLFRAPLYFYRFKLGFLLGERFIHLKHWGRKSGNLKETVIEVIDQDKTKGKLYSASGFGEKSQWFKNISVNHSVFVCIKNTEYKATARVLSDDEATDVLLRYVKAHPKSIKGVARLSGYEIDGYEQDVIEFSKIIKIVEFTLDGRT
ncbi:MAG: nitroreductase family deazaflavin-dependent oxidoreductase [Pseudomonadales bacterium]|nr:nitroreductase family deazaflavin-dependent oxidoreductase [Pseudomonadales bacterium]